METTNQQTPQVSNHSQDAALYIKYSHALNGSPLLVRDEETYNEGTLLLAFVQEALRKTDDAYEALYRPHKFEIDKITADFKPTYDKINLAKATITRGLQEYVDWKNEQQKLAVANLLSDPNTSLEQKNVQVAQIVQQTALPTKGTRRSKQLYITDYTKIPAKYWKVDEAQLKKDIIAGEQVEGAYVAFEPKVVASK